MCGWYEMAVEKLRLLYNLLKQKILSSEYIQVDESVIPVLDNEKHKAKKGYEWCVRDGITGDVMFHYDRGSRSGMVARELLGCCRGIVQCDGYAAYEQFERMKGITLPAAGHMSEENTWMLWKRTGPWLHRRFTTSASCTG